MSSLASDCSNSKILAALRFLMDRIDYERTLSMPCSEEAFKLDRMRELLRRLGDPQNRMPIVHVAGTKGKGSTAAMMAAVLSAAGYRTGLFTSPHLDRVEERIVIDGQPCSAEELAALVELVRPAVEALDRETEVEKGTGPICRNDPEGAAHKLELSPCPPLGPTYFEIITAAALCHFARRRVDAAVLEVGLGGRLDSTNVCTPAVSIITSISFDHVKQLGDTLAAIAAEKAGIIKPGVPVVSGVTADEPRKWCGGSPGKTAAGCWNWASISTSTTVRRIIWSGRHRRRSVDIRQHAIGAGRPLISGRGQYARFVGSPSGGQRGVGAGGSGGTAPTAVGRFPRRRSVADWPKWRGRRGWRSLRGGRPWCSTPPTTRPRSKRWSMFSTRVFPRGGDCWSLPRRRKRTCGECWSDCWASSTT